MSLSKYKKDKKFQAIRKFTDREKPTKVFKDALGDLIVDKKLLQVLVFYGVGGIGKTSLLENMYESLKEKIDQNHLKNFHTVFINLDGHEYDSSTHILIALRSQLKISAVLFDYALLRYWSLAGHSVLEIKSKFRNRESLIWDILEIIKDVGGIPVPFKLIQNTVKKLKGTYIAAFNRYKEEMNEIAELNQMELYRKLPYYLGLDVKDAYDQKGIKHVVFLDSYEAMLKKLESGAVMDYPDEWLMELIGSSEVGLFVTGSREYLKWSDYNKEWDGYIDQHILGFLSSHDADYFLRLVPIADENIRQVIINTANGLPLYLDLCVSIYEAKISKGEVPCPDDFRMAETEVINRFLRHMTPEERETVRVLSILNFFDFGIFKKLLSDFNIGYSFTRFKDFIEKSFVTSVDKKHKLYKIHNNIRDYILNNIENDLKEEIVKSALRYYAVNRSTYETEILAKNFKHIASLITLCESIQKEEAENILDLGFHLIDNGYWHEVREVADYLLSSNPEGAKRNENAFRLLRAVGLRRTGKLMDSYEEFERIDISSKSLWRFELPARFHKANVTRIMGNYSLAEKLYEQMLQSEDSTDNSKQLLIKIKRQQADLMMLRGRFKEAAASLEALIPVLDDGIEKAENLRILGHIYRFNMQLDTAEELYYKAMTIAEDLKAVGLIGKLNNNIVETLCWCRQDEAIVAAQKSLDINNGIYAQIETGKTLSALSIAYCIKGKDLDLAEKYAAESKSIQSEVGYQSGVLFSEIAAMFALLFKNNQKAAAIKKKDIDELIGRLDVYKFLRLPAYILFDDFEGIKKQQEVAQWLDFDITAEAFKNLKPSI